MGDKAKQVRVRFVVQGGVILTLVRKRSRAKLGAKRPTGVSLVKAGAEKE